GVPDERDPGAREVRKPVLRTHHADDAVRLSLEANVPADDAGVAAEARLPQAVAEHDDAAPALAVGRAERPPQQGPRAEHGEEVAGDARRRDRPRLAIAGEIQAREA